MDDDVSHQRDVRRGRLMASLATIEAGTMVVGVVLNYVSVSSAGEGVSWRLIGWLARLLYADSEANLWAWGSALLLASLALAFAVKALTLRGSGRAPLSFLGLAVVALWMSADEAAMLHEQLARANIRIGWTWSWLVLGVPLTLAVSVALLGMARSIDRVLRGRLIVAGSLFLLGALGVEILGGALAMNTGVTPGEVRSSALYHALVAVEEGLEIAGALLALWAVLASLDIRIGDRGVTIRSRDGAHAGSVTKAS